MKRSILRYQDGHIREPRRFWFYFIMFIVGAIATYLRERKSHGE